MDADRRPVGQHVAHAVHIPDAGRYRFNLARRQSMQRALGCPTAVNRACVGLRLLGAAQQTNQAPDGVVMYRRRLSRPPDKAHHRKTTQRVRVQQVLLITLRVRLGVSVGQPVVVRHQIGQQRTALVQDLSFRGMGGQQCGELLHEVAQPGQIGSGGHT